jgi:hypothetical protein
MRQSTHRAARAAAISCAVLAGVALAWFNPVGGRGLPVALEQSGVRNPLSLRKAMILAGVQYESAGARFMSLEHAPAWEEQAAAREEQIAASQAAVEAQRDAALARWEEGSLAGINEQAAIREEQIANMEAAVDAAAQAQLEKWLEIPASADALMADGMVAWEDRNANMEERWDAHLQASAEQAGRVDAAAAAVVATHEEQNDAFSAMGGARRARLDASNDETLARWAQRIPDMEQHHREYDEMIVGLGFEPRFNLD